ncbi:MAG: DUF4251 domain-containing protein, partial [Robiginitalea sp.]
AFQLLALSSCGTAKEPLSSGTWDKMEDMVTNRDFRFKARWAEPLQTSSMNRVANAGLIPPGSSVNRIDLTGTANFLKMEGDMVEVQLPYYGERQVNQTYGRAEGVAFEGPATDITTGRNKKKKYYDLDFNLKDKTEVLQCNLRIFSNRRAILTVYSNQRNMIRYVGEVTPQ